MPRIIEERENEDGVGLSVEELEKETIQLLNEISSSQSSLSRVIRGVTSVGTRPYTTSFQGRIRRQEGIWTGTSSLNGPPIRTNETGRVSRTQFDKEKKGKKGRQETNNLPKDTGPLSNINTGEDNSSIDSRKKEELKLKTLDFYSEQDRVRDKSDLFVVSPVKSIKKEKIRLEEEKRRAQTSEAKRERNILTDIERNQKKAARLVLEQEYKASIEIQRVWRGYCARQRVENIRLSRERAWQLVTDDLTQEKWWYNSLTGEVWRSDDNNQRTEIEPFPKNKKTPQGKGSKGNYNSLPPVGLSNTGNSIKQRPYTTQSTTQSSFSSQSKSSPSLPRLTKTGNSDNIPSDFANPESIDGFSELGSREDTGIYGSVGGDSDESSDETSFLSTTDPLFLPDGSKNSRLRETISSALRQSKYDSVSTLLAAGRDANMAIAAGLNKVKDPLFPEDSGGVKSPIRTPVKKKNIVSRPSTSAVVGARMVSIVKLPVPKGSKDDSVIDLKARSGQSNDDETDVIDLSHGPPAIRNVTYTGMKLEDVESISLPDTLVNNNQAEGEVDGNGMKVKKMREICFNCWSAGKGKTCEMHVENNGVNRITKAKDSVLVCGNWDLGVMRRRYRSEDIQEIFAKNNASLRWDKARAQFISVIESNHPSYRALYNLLHDFNRKKITKDHLRRWFKSINEVVRVGNISYASHSKQPQMLRLRNTLLNLSGVERFTRSTRDRTQPRAPQTDENEIVPSQIRNWGNILPGPIPPAISLYLPRKYPDPVEIKGEIPSSYIPPVGLKSIKIDSIIEPSKPESWIEKCASSVASACTVKSGLQFEKAVSKGSRSIVRFRTKLPPMNTKDWSIFARKVQPPKNFAVGGLPSSVALMQQITTRIPAQYGNYVAIDKQIIAPVRVPDYFAVEYVCLTPHATIPPLTTRILELHLNHRLFPSISISTCAPQDEKLYHGLNRPEQTGENEYTGFRTTHWTLGLYPDPETEAKCFIPADDIAIANLPETLSTLTSHAEITYDFCVPSTKENTALDFFHLMTCSSPTSNDPCCFTVLGKQESGKYTWKGDWTSPLGPIIFAVYRSFGYSQTGEIEQYKDRHGVPYWYNKRTGMTFWEPPIALEEEEDGLYLTDTKQEDYDTLQSKRVTEKQLRKYMVQEHKESVKRTNTKDQNDAQAKIERETQEVERKKQIKQQREESKFHGKLPKEIKPSTLPSRRTSKKSKAPNAEKESPRTLAPVAYKIARGEVSGREDLSARSNTQNPTPRSQVHGKGSEASPALKVPPLKLNETQKARKSSSTQNKDGKQAIVSAGNRDAQSEVGSLQLQGDHNGLVESITAALGQLLPTIREEVSSADQNKIFGIGLGLGLGLGLKQINTNMKSLSSKARPVSAGQGSSHTGRSGLSGLGSDRSILTDQQSDTDNGDNYEKEVSGKVTSAPDDLVAEHAKHRPAGAGKLFLNSGKYPAGPIVQSAPELPAGFVASIYSTHTGSQNVDYLPYVANINSPSKIGSVKPRKMLEDWKREGFDPWFAIGDQPVSDFLDRVAKEESSQMSKSTSSDLTVDMRGLTEEQRLRTQAAKEAEMLNQLFSFCRHGNYEKCEQMLDEDEPKLDIDSKDDAGNTLLLVAAQNNNMRIAKLALRRGANINEQNIAGQTVLHYCFAYGFQDSAAYFMSKGANDSLLNSEGLTCYEGLTKEAAEAI